MITWVTFNHMWGKEYVFLSSMRQSDGDTKVYFNLFNLVDHIK